MFRLVEKAASEDKQLIYVHQMRHSVVTDVKFDEILEDIIVWLRARV